MWCKVLGFLYQLEECITLGIIIRMAQHPFFFMLKREDMNEYVRGLWLCFFGGGGVRRWTIL